MENDKDTTEQAAYKKLNNLLRPLGYQDPKYAFLCNEATTPETKYRTFDQLIHPMGNTLLDLVTNINYWKMKFPWAFTDKDGKAIDKPLWRQIGQELVAYCKTKRFLGEIKTRGTGIWYDAGRIVLNDGITISGIPDMISESYLYTYGTQIKYDMNLPNKKVMDDLSDLIKASTLPESDREIYLGQLMAGFYCAVPSFRTHTHITGQSGAGKTFLAGDLPSAIWSVLGSISATSITAAAIRNAHSAKPWHLEEFVKTSKNEQLKNAEVIEVLKAASSGSFDARSSASQDFRSYEVLSAFILSSVSPVPWDEQMDSRVINIELKPKGGNDFNMKWAQLSNKLPALGKSLFWKAYQVAPLIRPATEKFVERFIEVVKLKNSARQADKYAYPLIGYHFLYNDAIPTNEQLEVLIQIAIKKMNSGNEPMNENREAENLLNIILEHPVKDVVGKSRKVLSIILEDLEFIKKYPATICKTFFASDNSKLYGIAYDKENHVFIRARLPEFSKISADAGYPDYCRVLQRLPISRGVKTRSIAGFPKGVNYLQLDLSAYMIEEKADIDMANIYQDKVEEKAVDVFGF